MGARNEFIKVNSRRLPVKFSLLGADAADDGGLQVTFEVHTRGDRWLLELDGYLPVPRTFAAGARAAITLDDAQCEELIFYEYDHLRFHSAKVVLSPRGDGSVELRVAGQVVDTGEAHKPLTISAHAVTRLEQVSVRPTSERAARAVLARTGLPGEFVWAKMSNGLWTFYSPRRARAEAAFTKLLPLVRELPREPVFKAAGLPPDRAALHASAALLRRAKAALRAELKRRWPNELRALMPDTASQLERLLAI